MLLCGRHLRTAPGDPLPRLINTVLYVHGLPEIRSRLFHCQMVCLKHCVQVSNAAASLQQAEGTDVSVLLPAAGAQDPGAQERGQGRGSLRQALTGLQFRAFVGPDARGLGLDAVGLETVTHFRQHFACSR